MKRIEFRVDCSRPRAPHKLLLLLRRESHLEFLVLSSSTCASPSRSSPLIVDVRPELDFGMSITTGCEKPKGRKSRIEPIGEDNMHISMNTDASSLLYSSMVDIY